jgi:hypothetical protein
MTAAGLIMTALVISLLVAREVVRLRAPEPLRTGPFTYAISVSAAVWAVLVVIRLADYLG